GCSPSPLAPSYASAAAVDVLGAEDVGAASGSAKRRSSKGKGGRGGGGGSGSGGGGSSGGSGGSGGGDSGGSGGGSGGVGGGGGGTGASGGSGSDGSGGGRTGAQRGGSGGGQRQWQQRRSETPLPQQLRESLFQRGASGGSVSCSYVIRTGDHAGQKCGKPHTQHRCFSRLDDAWRAEFGDEVERPHWAELLRSGVAIFDLDYDAILSAMYALYASAEGASESSLPGTAPAEALHTFTLDSGASRCFFRDSTTLTPLAAPIPVRLADPSGGPVVARSSTVLPCPVVPSSSLSGLHLPSFSTNLVSTAALQDSMVTTTTPGGQQTLATEPPQVAASAQPCLRGMHSRLLVSGLPRSLPPLPPSPAPPCLPCVEKRQRAAPHSSSFPLKTAPLQTLHMDVWGPARVSGQGRKRYFLLRFCTYLPVQRLHSDRVGEFSSDLLRDLSRGEGILQSFTLPDSPQKNGIAEHRICLVMEVAHTSMIHAAAPHLLWLFAVRYAAHQLNLWPRVSLPETLPTLRWTGKVGDASLFRVWGSRAFVRDTSADKLSAHAISCVFLCLSLDALGWQFYHPTWRRVFPSQDSTFDEAVPFYRLFPYRSAPPPPPPLFLALGPPPVDHLPGTVPVEVAGDSGAARGAASGGAEPGVAEPGGAELGSVEPGGVEPRGAEFECAELGGVELGGVELGGAELGGVEPGDAEPGGGEPAGLEPGGAGPEGVEPGGDVSEGAESGVAESRGAASSGAARAGATRDPRVGGARVTAGAGGTGGTAAAGPGGARTRGTGAAGTGGVGGARAGDPMEPGSTGAGGAAAGGTGAGARGAGAGGTSAGGAGAGAVYLGARGAGAGCAGGTGAGGTVRPRPYFVPLLQQVLASLPSQSGGVTERREPASRPASPVRTSRRVPRSRPPPVPGTQTMALRPSSVPLRVPLPPPPESSLPTVPDLGSDLVHAASPTVSRLLSTVVTNPSFQSNVASALVAELLDFADACRLDYATALVADSKSASPPSVGGECALDTDVLEDRQEDFECLVATVPCFASMLLAPEGYQDAPDIPTPCSYAEAITGPYSSKWQAAMDAKMASWKSTGTLSGKTSPSALRLPVLLATAHSSIYQPLALSSTFGQVCRAECCEAEIYAGAMAAQELCWLTYLLTNGLVLLQFCASESGTLPGTAPAQALHTFTLDSGASRCFFRDSTTLTPLPAPVPVRLADPSGGPVLARSSHVLPCPAYLSVSLSGLHLPSFSTNLVSTAALQDAMVTTTTPGVQRVSICTCTRTGRHLAMFTCRPGSSPYTLATEPPHVAASAQVSTCPSPPSVRRGAAARRSSLLLVSPDDCSTADSPHGLRLQLRERLGQDLPVLRLHPDRGGEFSSNLLQDFCRGEGILQSFTLPDSPQQNGIVERRIGLVMEVARTSLIHAAAPHFLWPFADITFDESVPFYCLFPYHSTPPPPPPLFLAPGPPPVDHLPPQGPAPSGVSQVDPLPGTAPVEVAVGSGAAPGAASGGAGSEGAGSEGAEPGGEEPGGAKPEGIEPGVLSRKVWSLGVLSLGSGTPGAGGAGDAGAGGAGVTATAGPGGARTRGTGATGTGGVGGAGAGDPTELGAAGAGGSCAGGAGAGGAGAGGPGFGGTGAGCAGATGAGAVDPGAGGAGGTVRSRLYFVPLLQQPASPLPAPSPYTEKSGGLTKRREPASCPVSPVHTTPRAPRSRPPPVPGTHAMVLRPSSVPLRFPLPAPPDSSLTEVPGPESDRARAASPTISLLLATAVIDPSFESAAASALVVELLDFAVACRLDYATSLVAESESASPPSVGGECALGTDVLEDRQEDFECRAATVPHFASMLLALEGDPDAPNIPTPCSYAEAITGPYSSQCQAAMDGEMASWNSTGTYVDEVPPPEANIVDDMWIFRVKRPPGSPPAFKARYVARGFRLHLRLGFAPSTADPSLFLHTDTSLPPFYVLVYVDDLVFATADTEALTLVKSGLQKRHSCTDLGELRSYLGLQITWDRAWRTIILTQSHMVHQVVQHFGFQFSSPQPTPLSTGHSLSAPPLDESVEPSGPYPELVGCLMYLMTCT
ncbi:unnamed protein product, partial [Closterium sp. NIES-54]